MPSAQKKKKETLGQNYIRNPIDLTDIYITFYPNTKE